MAKKKEDESVPETMDDFTDRIFDEVDKEYGPGVLIDGQSATNEKRMVIPISPALDVITSGGIVEGSWVGITGNPKTTKTSLALSIAANCQKPEYGGRPVYYCKAEGRLSLRMLESTQGLNLSKGKFNIIQSKKGCILTAEQHLKILVSILRGVPGACVIIDSASALCGEAEMNAGIGFSQPGTGAKLFAQFVRLMNQVVPVNKSVVIVIAHLISNIGGMTKGYTERSARAVQYQYDYMLRTIMKKAWKDGERQIGYEVKWACNNSPLGDPGMTIDSYVRFGIGVDRLYEMLKLGLSANLVRKSGAWFYLEYLGKDQYKHLLLGGEVPKGQGGEGVYRLLMEHPEWADVLEKEVVAIAGRLVGSDE